MDTGETQGMLAGEKTWIYTAGTNKEKTGAKAMNTVKVLSDGNIQTIQIPISYNFPFDEVFINRIGETIVLTPMEALARSFERGAAILTDDFLADGVPESMDSIRESL